MYKDLSISMITVGGLQTLESVGSWHLSAVRGVFIFRLLSTVLRHDRKIIYKRLCLGKGTEAGIGAFVFQIDVLTSL